MDKLFVCTDCDCKVRKTICDLISYMMKKARTFTVEDFFVFKIYLISAGALMGSIFSEQIKKIAPLLKIFCAFGFIYMIWRVFLTDCEE